jgi:hypothetical protein
MFKFKRSKICKANKDLLECNIISDIRNYQQQLEQIKGVDLSVIVDKYFSFNNNYDFDVFYVMDKIISKKSLCAKYGNFEEGFKAFGKEIDEYIEKDKIIKGLIDKIKDGKNKLGIKEGDSLYGRY